MKRSDKFSAFETNVGKYSHRKIPQWRMGHHELLEYLDFMSLEGDDGSLNTQSA